MSTTTTAVEVMEVSHLSSKKTTLSENCGSSSEEGSPKEVVTIECGSSSCSDNDEILCHDLWRIALYYIYIEMTPAQVESHVDAQRRVCEELGLMGRIRVSKEGVNGVLSGKYEVLRVYEKKIAGALQEAAGENATEKRKLQGGRIVTEKTKTADNNNEEDDDDDDRIIRIDLDIKYCELRAELPIQKQLFDRLIVKETKNVIGLFDQSHQQEQQRQQQKPSKSEKYRRRRERKRQEQEAKRKTNVDNLHQLSQATQAQQQSFSSTILITPTNDEIITLADKDGDEAIGKQPIPSAPAPAPSSRPLDMSSLYRSVMEEPLKPARHLSATEWNEKLDAVASSDKSALLLDVRNVYEMKVGHFAHPSTPTLLTNTRKYSDLPQMLASNQEMQERDQIFMYCTGGVRCERVSMLVHELYPEKEIYQLQGGIQRYLETCSEQQNQQLKEEVGTSNIDSTEKNPSYFVGKNFVFDPRRTDPIHFGETVGRCLICKSPHDDYDNGHAPSENKEARCNNCRMLILICNDCRPKYRCHGEKDHRGGGGGDDDDDDDDDDDFDDKTQQQESSNDSFRPLLYCNVDTCIHEGSKLDPELRTTTK